MTVALFEEPRTTGIQGSYSNWEIQRLRRDDLDALAAHLIRLGKADRRNRFGAVATDAQLADFAHRCDPDRDIVVVVKQGTQIAGVCQLAICRDASRHSVAELGISVDAPMRRAGWAIRMLREALTIARQHQVAELVVHYLHSNLAMAAFVDRIGAVNEEEYGDEVTARFPLPAGESDSAGACLCARGSCPFRDLCAQTR